MKTKRGFRLRELGGDYILIGESAELINFNNLITFNEAAAYLWQNVEGKEFDVETLTQLLLDHPFQFHIQQLFVLQWMLIQLLYNILTD